MRTRVTRCVRATRSGLALVLGLCLGAWAAGASVPGTLSYQGLLLDAGGSPVNGSADLVFRLFDAPAAGNLLWSEVHDDVPVSSGVYQVVLGETVPLTPGVVSAGSLHLEIAVDGETLAPRQRLLAVPYALRAASADSAETIAGLDPAFTTQIFQHFSWDGGAPPSDDPSEGFADVDGDGRANFVDDNNDGDYFTDVSEPAGGLNLVTPHIGGFGSPEVEPAAAEASVATRVRIRGLDFDPAMTVHFGAQALTPADVTTGRYPSTGSADVDAGPQPPGTVEVAVTLPNGQTSPEPGQFTFIEHQPTVSSLQPSAAVAGLGPVQVQIAGSGFANGLEVDFGTATFFPEFSSVTSSVFGVSVGPHAPGTVPVTLSYPSGLFASASFDFLDLPQRKLVFVTSGQFDGNLGGLSGADALCTAAASAAGLPGSYRAWLSDLTGSPSTRFTQSAVPYARVDGGILAMDWADLIDGTIGASLTTDEYGDPLGPARVWSNTTATGTFPPFSTGHCVNWTSASAPIGTISENQSSLDGSVALRPCPSMYHLLCFEQ